MGEVKVAADIYIDKSNKRLTVVNKKELGQVFTPRWVAELILDKLGYTLDNPELLSKKILEPSYGEGAFIYPILDRLVTAASAAGKSNADISQIIADNVWGIEYDEGLADKTTLSLNAYLSEQGIPEPKWNLYSQDSLTFTKPDFFDYVVGNPPYIRIHDMNEELRKNVKKFSHSSGNTDLYIIFFELALEWLNDKGQLGYITPNSYMKNASQGKFRKQIVEERLLKEIIDFGGRPIFSDAATYTAITILSKENKANREHVGYSFQNGVIDYTAEVDYADLIAKPSAPLVFAAREDLDFLKERQSRPVKIGDKTLPQHGIATLRDKLYTSIPENVEPEVKRIAVKASTYKGAELNDYILFPYKEEDGVIKSLSEEELALYPNAYAYLLSHKEELITRDMDKGINWFQYGRSQGIVNTSKKKLVFSHVISANQDTIKVFELPAGSIVYSGIFITATEGSSLQEIKEILESKEFCRYAKLCGKDMAGGFKALSIKALKDYGI